MYEERSLDRIGKVIKMNNQDVVLIKLQIEYIKLLEDQCSKVILLEERQTYIKSLKSKIQDLMIMIQ